MEYTYDKKWEIEDERVSELDRLRSRLNRHLSILSFQMGGGTLDVPYQSRTTVRKLGGTISLVEGRLRKLLGDKESLSSFDRLVAEDVLENLKIVKAYQRYMYRERNGFGVGSMYSAIFGNSAYSEILRAVTRRGPTDDLIHRCDETVMDDYDGIVQPEIVSINFKDKWEEFKRLLDECKGVVDRFYEEIGVVKKTSDYQAVFSSPEDGESCWDDRNSMLVLTPNNIWCLKEEGSNNLVLSSAEGKVVSVHERTHGHHSERSRQTMPFGLQTNYKPNPLSRKVKSAFHCAVHGAVSEGVPFLLEDLFLRAAYKDPGKFEMTNKEVEIIGLLRRTYTAKSLPQIAYDLLAYTQSDQELGDCPPQLIKEASKSLEDRTGIKRYRIDSNAFESRPIDSTIKDSANYFGEKRIRSLFKKMERRGVPQNIAISALLSGFWCSRKAQERFIFSHFIPYAMQERAENGAVEAA